jgi:hypothetical protein
MPTAHTLTPAETLRLDTLAHLMRIIAQQPAITLTPDDAAPTWSIDLSTWRAQLPTHDLTARDEDHCRGVAVHEAAHAAITRLGDMVPAALLRRPGVHALLNALEDLRIEDWVVRRFPGVAAWIDHSNAALWPPRPTWPRPLPLSLMYNACLIRKQLGQALPDNTPAPVVEAVAKTWGAVQRVIAAQPPATIQDPAAAAAAYEASHLPAIYWADDQDAPPDAFEMLARLQQWRAWEVIYAEILPTYEAFLDHDQRTAGEALRRALAQWLSQLRGQSVLGQKAGRRQRQGAPSVVAQAPPELRAALGLAPPPAASSRGDDSGGIGAGTGSGAVEQRVAQALAYDPADLYLAAWRRIAHLIDALAEELMQLFERDQRLRWRRGFSHGERINMRAAMRFEAQPERYTELWMRKSLPTVIDPAFLLLIDRSGSMEGERIQRALDAAVLLVEVCARLQVPVEIWSFADDHTQDMTWDQTPDEAARLALGGLLSRAGGGTGMHAALYAARARFAECPHREPALFVLSDGDANDKPRVRAAVGGLMRDGVTVVGLGMGPDTACISDVFPEAIAQIEPEQLVGALAARVRAQLTARAA